MKRLPSGDLELSFEEMEGLMNARRGGGLPPAKICECGAIGPLWEWAKRDPKMGCEKCKALPSMEDLTGQRHETTPKDWKPK